MREQRMQLLGQPHQYLRSQFATSFLRAWSLPLTAHRCTGAEISQIPWFPHFWCAARDLRFVLLCVEPSV